MIEPLAILVIIAFAAGFKVAAILAIFGIALCIAILAKTAKEGE